MTDTQQAAVERVRAYLAHHGDHTAPLNSAYPDKSRYEWAQSAFKDDLRTILSALSTPSGEPEACPSPGGCPYCEQFGCPRGGEPEMVKQARERIAAYMPPTEEEQADMPLGSGFRIAGHDSDVDVITAYEAGLRASQSPRPALPEDVRALVAEARQHIAVARETDRCEAERFDLVQGSTSSGIMADICTRLAAALQRQAETQPCDNRAVVVEIETALRVIENANGDLDGLDRDWPKSKRGLRAERHVRNLEERLAAIKSCCDDALVALSAETQP